MMHDEAIDAACLKCNAAFGRGWPTSDAEDDEFMRATMRSAVAAYCRARAEELTAGSFGVGEANYAARLEDTADELEAAQGQSERG